MFGGGASPPGHHRPGPIADADRETSIPKPLPPAIRQMGGTAVRPSVVGPGRDRPRWPGRRATERTQARREDSPELVFEKWFVLGVPPGLARTQAAPPRSAPCTRPGAVADLGPYAGIGAATARPPVLRIATRPARSICRPFPAPLPTADRRTAGDGANPNGENGFGRTCDLEMSYGVGPRRKERTGAHRPAKPRTRPIGPLKKQTQPPGFWVCPICANEPICQNGRVGGSEKRSQRSDWQARAGRRPGRSTGEGRR